MAAAWAALRVDRPLESSTRRHASRGAGAWRTSLQNGLFVVLHQCGLSPRHLHRWYHRRQSSAPEESALFRPGDRRNEPTLDANPGLRNGHGAAVTVSFALLLVTLPGALLTLTEKREPLSANVVGGVK